MLTVMVAYRTRVVDGQMERSLRIAGAIHLRGPRASGKTSTARQHARSEVRLDRDPVALSMAASAPGRLLRGATPRLIDEWQAAPDLWNQVRHEVDDRQAKGQFILTGSSAPESDGLRHPGAGRFVSVDMRTMALSERLAPDAARVSLRALFDGAPPAEVETSLLVPDYADLIVQGGWPGLQDLDADSAQEVNLSYAEEMAEHDFPEVAGRRRDPRLFHAFLTAYAATQGQPAQLVTVRKRMGDVIGREPAPDTAAHLHGFARRLFLVEDQPAWSPRLRSRRAVLQAPKRHLCDVGLAAALLGARGGDLLGDPATLGHLFESLAVHDLRVYAQAMRARGVFHHRDSKGREEIDVVVEDARGAWVGCEVKLSHEQVESAARNLIRVAAGVERPPSALVVVIPGGPAYRRADGVCVVPLACLGP